MIMIPRFEIENIVDWTGRNRMELNFKKAWEMIIHGNVTYPLPEPLPTIARKSWFKDTRCYFT